MAILYVEKHVERGICIGRPLYRLQPTGGGAA